MYMRSNKLHERVDQTVGPKKWVNFQLKRVNQIVGGKGGKLINSHINFHQYLPFPRPSPFFTKAGLSLQLVLFVSNKKYHIKRQCCRLFAQVVYAYMYVDLYHRNYLMRSMGLMRSSMELVPIGGETRAAEAGY